MLARVEPRGGSAKFLIGPIPYLGAKSPNGKVGLPLKEMRVSYNSLFLKGNVVLIEED